MENFRYSIDKSMSACVRMRRELDEAQAECTEIQQKIRDTELELTRLQKRHRELRRGYLSPGRIEELVYAIAHEEKRIACLRNMRVRVTNEAVREQCEYTLAKITPKRIYLTKLSDFLEEYFDKNGKSKYSGSIIPDDLEKILRLERDQKGSGRKGRKKERKGAVR